jgi:hypothetical protein
MINVIYHMNGIDDMDTFVDINDKRREIDDEELQMIHLANVDHLIPVEYHSNSHGNE